MLVEKERFLVDVSEFMQCCWQTVPSLNTVGSMSVSKNTTVSYGAAYRKSQSAVFMLPTKSVPSAVVGTVLGGRDYAAGLEESFTGEVRRLQKFCRYNC